MPILSIIITFYDEPELILDAIRSCARIVPESIEIIVIDDGSEHDLKRILNQLVYKPSQLIIHRQSNQGVSAARTTGIQLARGEYLTFLDADDEFEPCDLNPYLTSREQIIRLGMADVSPRGEVINRAHDAPTQAGIHYLATAIKGDNFMPTCWGYLYKSEWIQNSGIRFSRHITHSEDSLFIIEALTSAQKVSAHAIPFYRYKRRTGSATSRDEPAYLRKRLSAMQRFLRQVAKIHRKHPQAALDIYIKKYWNYMLAVSLRTKSRRSRLIALQSQLELLCSHYFRRPSSSILGEELVKLSKCFKSLVSTRYVSTNTD